MEQKRFLELISAYGADPRRWPESERAAAQALAAANPQACEELLRAEAALDSAMDAAPTLAVAAELRRRVDAGAPQLRADMRRLSWGSVRGGALAGPARRGFWAPGAGLAAACAAGAIFGIFVADRLTATSQADGVLALSAATPLSDAGELTGNPYGR